MQAKREHRRYENGAKVWVGRYRNSHNKPHWHYDCELLYVECGKLELTVNRESFCATAGQAVFIAGGQTHQMQALMPDTELSMIIFDGDIVKEFAGECTLSHPLLTGDYGISETAGEIEADLKNRALFFQCETASKIQMLMIKIFRGEEIAEPRKVSPPPNGAAKKSACGNRRKISILLFDRRRRFHGHEHGLLFAIVSQTGGHDVFSISEPRARRKGSGYFKRKRRDFHDRSVA